MYLLNVLNPVAQLRGALESKSISNRPATLQGKTVGLVWDGFASGDQVLKGLGGNFSPNPPKV